MIEVRSSIVMIEVCSLYFLLSLKLVNCLQFYFSALQKENAKLRMGLVMAVANSFMTLQHYELALKYYLMLEGCASNNVCLSAQSFRFLHSSNVVGLQFLLAYIVLGPGQWGF